MSISLDTYSELTKTYKQSMMVNISTNLRMKCTCTLLITCEKRKYQGNIFKEICKPFESILLGPSLDSSNNNKMLGIHCVRNVLIV